VCYYLVHCYTYLLYFINYDLLLMVVGLGLIVIRFIAALYFIIYLIYYGLMMIGFMILGVGLARISRF